MPSAGRGRGTAARPQSPGGAEGAAAPRPPLARCPQPSAAAAEPGGERGPRPLIGLLSAPLSPLTALLRPSVAGRLRQRHLPAGALPRHGGPGGVQHQGDVPLSAPQRGRGAAGRQVHPQVQGRGHGARRGECGTASVGGSRGGV